MDFAEMVSSGESMLKLLEGSEVEVPVGANSKNAMVPLVTVDTTNILFICGGAFPDLNDIIKERLSKSSSMGFNAELKDKYDEDKNLQKHAGAGVAQDIDNIRYLAENMSHVKRTSEKSGSGLLASLTYL